MASSLIHERPLVFSPTLAATIGLEEAVMLHLLHDAALLTGATGGSDWHEVDKQHLLRLLPFWSERDCQRIAASLRDKGVLAIESAPLEQSPCLRYSLAARTPAPRTAQRKAPQPLAGSKSLIAGRWQPDEEVLRQLALHGITRAFAEAQLDEFVMYWSDRGEPAFSWNAKYRSHVIRRWREQEAHAEVPEDLPRPIGADWEPGADAMEILLRAGVSRHFIEDAVPEFVLYWTERREASRTWNSRFVTHVKRQWARYTATMDLDGEPRRIPANWQPAPDVYDILRMANIDAGFARTLLPEFVMFWTDAGEAHPSWNSKFLQHVKYHWARSHRTADTAEQSHGARQRAGGTGNTRSRSLVEDLTDRSWAD
jgi:DnaT DNA-binding domain